MGGDSRRGDGRSWGRGGWIWHWIHHHVCWKGCEVVNARTCYWLIPPGHIAMMARLTLVDNVALCMEAPTGNPRLPRLLLSSLSHTHRSMADPITSWYCYRYAGTSQAFHFLFLNTVLFNFSLKWKKAIFLSSFFFCNKCSPHIHFYFQCQHTHSLTQSTHKLTGIVPLKMNPLLSFTHPRIIPNQWLFYWRT